MKGTILDAHIEGRVTYVKKHTKYGTFESKVVLHPEDDDVKSQIDGYNFAEEKCDIQALKRKAQFFEQRYEGVKHAYDVLKNSGCDPDTDTMLKLKRQVKKAKELYWTYYDLYKTLEETRLERINKCLEYRRKIRKKNI